MQRTGHRAELKLRLQVTQRRRTERADEQLADPQRSHGQLDRQLQIGRRLRRLAALARRKLHVDAARTQFVDADVQPGRTAAALDAQPARCELVDLDAVVAARQADRHAARFEVPEQRALRRFDLDARQQREQARGPAFAAQCPPRRTKRECNDCDKERERCADPTQQAKRPPWIRLCRSTGVLRYLRMNGPPLRGSAEGATGGSHQNAMPTLK